MGLVVGLILFSDCDRRGRRRLGCGSGFFFPFGSLPLCSIGVLWLFLSPFWLRFLIVGLVVGLLFESILGATDVTVD